MNPDIKTIVIIIVTLSPFIIDEIFAQSQNFPKIITLSLVGIFGILIVIFRYKLAEWTGKIPYKLKLIRTPLVKLIKFLGSPKAKQLLFIALILGLLFVNQFWVKIILGVYLFLLYRYEIYKKKYTLPWEQGKKPLAQDPFNEGLVNWETISGKGEIEQDFGNPAPDVLLKQVGNTSALPQTFLVWKNEKIERPSTIECEVYIQPGGIFNLVFGMDQKDKDESSYFMARLDTRETEFDSLLYKNPREHWNFITRSDKSRTEWKTWHRVKIEILSKNEVSFYKDGELIITREVKGSLYGHVGIMSEEEDVHVDNFVITPL